MVMLQSRTICISMLPILYYRHDVELQHICADTYVYMYKYKQIYKICYHVIQAIWVLYEDCFTNTENQQHVTNPNQERSSGPL